VQPADLESLVERELRQLPLPRAPHTLLPRVLAAVQHWAGRPWYARAWFTWPLAWQAVSIAALVLIVAAGAMLVPSAQAAAGRAASGITASIASAGPISEAAALARRAEVTINALRILWRALVEPMVPYAFALVMLMCLASAAFATALNRVAFGRVPGRVFQS
jgi:hypothetical protein